MENVSRDNIWNAIFNNDAKALKTGGRYFYRLALKRIKAGESICDAGCGYTFYMNDLMKRCGPHGSFIGVDFSSVALTKSSELTDQYPNARLILADILNIPIADGSVDRVFCAETLPYLIHHVGDALKELGRIARKEVIFSLHTRGAYEIKGTGNEYRGNIVIEHKPGAKPPRIVFDRDEILALVKKTMPHFHVRLIKPFRWLDLLDVELNDEEWPWYMPPKETIALYYVIVQRN